MKKVLKGTQASEVILDGAYEVYSAVASTMGYGGKNVVISRPGGIPLSTKDGVTVAKNISLSDPGLDVGASIMKEVSSKMLDTCGDGTTTATVLAYTLLEAIYEAIQLKSVTPTEVRKIMPKLVNDVVEFLRYNTIHIDNRTELEYVARISANNDPEIGNIIASAFWEVGRDGVVNVELNKSPETKLEIVNGFKIDKGYCSPYFADKSGNVVLNDVGILVIDGKITNPKEIIPILEYYAKHKLNLLIICDTIDDTTLDSLIVNHRQGILNSCVIKTGGYGDDRLDELNDIALYTGARVFNTSHKIQDMDIHDIGLASKVVCTKNSCNIITKSGDSFKITERTQELWNQYNQESVEYLKNKIKQRISNLSSSVAVIKVGGHTQSEIQEKLDRVDDAVHAVRSAYENGYSSGGGVAYLSASGALSIGTSPDDTTVEVAKILCKALDAPFRVMLTNLDYSLDQINMELNLSKSSGDGIDCSTGNRVNMKIAGIIDSTQTLISAIEIASSVAVNFATTNCVIIPDTHSINDLNPNNHGNQ